MSRVLLGLFAVDVHKGNTEAMSSVNDLLEKTSVGHERVENLTQLCSRVIRFKPFRITEAVAEWIRSYVAAVKSA